MKPPAASAASRFDDAKAGIASTTKWLVGGVATTLVAVLVGTPLTNIGRLEPGGRLALAGAAAATAYLLLGVILWRALAIVGSEGISVNDLAKMKGWAKLCVGRVERRMSGRLPDGCATFAALARHTADIAERANAEGDNAQAQEDLARLREQVRGLMPEVTFEYKHAQFVWLQRLIVALLPFVIAAVSLFAWAANPPERPTLSDQPQKALLRLSRDERLALASTLKEPCYPPAADGGLSIDVLIVRRLAGRTEAITLPPPGCPPLRLTRQDGVWFVPK